MIAGPPRVPAPDGARSGDVPLLVLAEGTSFKGMKLHYLAAGGMSVAYKALAVNGKSFFVKEVAKDQAQAVVSLTQEKALLERLQHPSIPRLHDFCEWREHLYLIQDFVDGTNLEQQISPFPDIFLPEARVRDWALQLCDILQYLHGHQPPIIYRDLKPKNILLHPSGRIYLVDFGIARAYKEGKDQDTRLLGSVLTASPEHYGGQTDVRSDLYTLGATLYYLLTNGQGERLSPFDFPPISALRSDVSDELQAVLKKCVERAPKHRFASIEELRQALQGGPLSVALEPEAPSPAPPPATAARPGLPAWAMIAMGLVLGWLLNGLFRRNPGPPVAPPILSSSPAVDVNPTPSLIATGSGSPTPPPVPQPAAEKTASPRSLPVVPRPTRTPSPQPTQRPIVRPSPPRLEPDKPAYPQRRTPPAQRDEDGVQEVLAELGSPWGHFQDFRAQDAQGAQAVGLVKGPEGLFALQAPEGFRYLGVPRDFLLLRWQRRNFEALRVRTLMGRSCSLADLTAARQRQFASHLQKTVQLTFQGRSLKGLVLQVPNRRFLVVEVLWTQTQPPFTMAISGGAGAPRFPSYVEEFQAHLQRFRFTDR